MPTKIKTAITGLSSIALVSLGLASMLVPAHALPPLEAYGKLPQVDDIAISPDGKTVGFLRSNDDGEAFIFMNLETGESSGVGAGGIKARSVYFASPNFAILRGSETTRRYTRNKYEVSGAFSFDLKTRKVTQLGKDVEDLYPAQSGYGRIVGLSDDGKYAFMPGFVGQLGSDPAYDLLRVRLDRPNGRVHSSGRQNTIDWFVARDGRVLAREDLDPRRENYRLNTEVTGKFELVYEDDNTKFVPFSVVGILPDETGVVIIDRGDEEEFSSVRVLNFDGTMGRSLFTQTDRGIEYLLTDENRYVVGAKFRGETPTYSFLDPAVDSAVATLVSQYNGLSVDIYDWTADFANILVRISGGGVAPKYYFYKPGEKRLSSVISAHEGIEDGDVGAILQIQYKAEDGLTIPAIVTLPPGTADPKNMPMIVMPHGGPAAYDRVGFDWMAQYFASRGYLVFQPNFRGSTGYGISFRDAGDGEWGGKMQDDITDGVNLLTRNGWADANRVCIIGGSYGGYAALAGGFLTPDLYKCVGAIAPVADLDLMLKDVKSDRGKHSTTYAYWSRLIGDRREDREKISAISPADNAEKFKAPVLLLHGVDDTVVPYSHSRVMERALKRAGKSVDLVKLKGEDHFLSLSETRLETLRALDEFVASTIGRNEVASLD